MHPRPTICWYYSNGSPLVHLQQLSSVVLGDVGLWLEDETRINICDLGPVDAVEVLVVVVPAVVVSLTDYELLLASQRLE